MQQDVCKMMESVIRDHIATDMSSNNLFVNERHGFVPNRDCMTNLIGIGGLDRGNKSACDIDVIYTDFAKAFDLVPHRRLLTKLAYWHSRRINMDYDVVNRANAKKCVDGELSSWAYAKNGIPQGSVLRPILL